METQTTVPGAGVPSYAPPASSSGNKYLILIVLAVVVLAAVGIWFFFLQSGKTEPQAHAFRVIENGFDRWYELSLDDFRIAPSVQPANFESIPSERILPGDFSSIVTEGGDVMTLSLQGLEAVSTNGTRTILIERPGLDYGSSALSHDGSGVALFNAVTNHIDYFSLDNVRPTVLSYEGSVLAPPALYGVGALPMGKVVVKTSESSFEVYEILDGAARHLGSSNMASSLFKDHYLAVFESSTAHAWTYPSNYGATPVSANAVTTLGQRCTGSQLASLGQASGSGSMPSVQTTVWSYLPTPGNLPADYNNGTYCIQAKTIVSYSPPTATLSASPTSITSGNSSTLTWNSTSATSCSGSGTGFSTGNAISGTISVSPTSNTTYTVTCTGPGGSANASVTVSVSGGGGGGCFAPDIPVTMADGSTKPISEVKVGDRVLGEDESGNRVPETVTELFVHNGGYETLLVNGSLVVTPNHPIRVVRGSSTSWMEAGDMRVGDFLVGETSLVRIESIEAHGTLPTVHNLEVVPHHTYFAGGVLVHNIKN